MKKIIVCINKKPSYGNVPYEYEDSINYKNDSSIEIHYSGQRCGVYDFHLINGVEAGITFEFYYRDKKSGPFTYLGASNNVQIIRDRTNPLNGERAAPPEKRLKLRAVIDIKNIPDKARQEVPVTTDDVNYRYKNDVLCDVLFHSGIMNDSNVSIKPGLNNGFQAVYVVHRLPV